MSPARKPVKGRDKGGHSGLRIGIGLGVLLLSLMILFSLLIPTWKIDIDRETMTRFEMTAFDFGRGTDPQILNPVGPFGAWFAWWMKNGLGHFFSICLMIAIAAFGFAITFLRSRMSYTARLLLFLMLSLFASLTILLVSKSAFFRGDFTQGVLDHLALSFGGAGTVIILITLILINLYLLFGFETVNTRFMQLCVFIGRFFRIVFHALRSESIPVETPAKRESLPVKTRPEALPPKEEKRYEPVEEPPLPFDDERMIPIDGDPFEDPFDEEEPPPPPVKTKPKPNRQVPNVVEGEDGPKYAEYAKPDIERFLVSHSQNIPQDTEQLKRECLLTSDIILKKLKEFQIDATVENYNKGPIITQYEIKPPPGVRVNRFSALQDDLALAIKAKNVRVQAPIPGRGLIGVEVPNRNRETIYLKDILLCDDMMRSDSPMMVALGKDIAGVPVVTDLTKMPHLLIAGATGAGKSVCINTMINSILFRATPEQVRLVMIDPKRIELSGYEGIPHLIQSVVTDPNDAITALNWGVSEMERRYQLLQVYQVRDIASYNAKIRTLKKVGEEIEDRELPFIVILVDEFADLIMTAGRDIEQPISRLAQMARAIGIHLILATQRPSTKVITGIIKANFPARIAFQVSSMIDSRVILDSNGAERLLGRGDMLFLGPGKAQAERIHGAYLSDDEIANLVAYLRMMPKPDYQIQILGEEVRNLSEFEYDDELFPDAARAVVSAGMASVSMLQRHFKIGYARAGRLIDLLEQAKVVGPHLGSKSREVLLTYDDLEGRLNTPKNAVNGEDDEL